MDELTRQMDFSGGLSGEKGEISEFIYDVSKQHLHIKHKWKGYLPKSHTHTNTFTLMDHKIHLNISAETYKKNMILHLKA